MADPTARALRLLELLQSAPPRTAAELAERLGVDERTVRRDVARLGEAGVHVEVLRGRYGGYRLAPGRRVLPIVFSGAEVVAVFLGFTHARESADEPDTAVRTALAKIKRAMRPEDAERVAAALAAMTRGARRGDVDPDPAVTLALAEAVSRSRVVELRYRSGEGVLSRRRVHPRDLVAHAGRWYLVAYDTDKREERTFRVDRIRTARALAETFSAPQRPDAAARLAERFADADYRWRVVLRVRATEDHIRAHLPPSVARLRRLDPEVDGADGSAPPWYRAEIRAESLDWIPPVIAALDRAVVIDQPDALRERVRTAATRMLRAASGEDG
ncbi:WYL domain-containing protein [Streptomonospora sp. S1-112]|uniref:WYL domain-containing protein n=1 Tax=Streptomonospora mangrovi TaxID=2883123 RepID=A0A9X3SGT3_9ACTN|nr:WYL domain-containing protein [Streptomonospora mangrovi]MDA0567282.1 WYL domain-containing protein [Streptomonospora mangrovi]